MKVFLHLETKEFFTKDKFSVVPEGSYEITPGAREIFERFRDFFGDMTGFDLNSDYIITEDNIFSLIGREKVIEYQFNKIDVECEAIIEAGFNVPELDKNFTYDRFDQINLSTLALMVPQMKHIPFNDGLENNSRVYTAEEFMSIFNSGVEFSTYHRTYRQQLRRMIENMSNINDILAVEYGVTNLEGEYQDRMNEVMDTFDVLQS